MQVTIDFREKTEGFLAKAYASRCVDQGCVHR